MTGVGSTEPARSAGAGLAGTGAGSAGADLWSGRADAYRESATHASGDDLDLVVAWCEPAPGVTVLDVATGGGHVARRLREAGATVVTLDPAPGMLLVPFFAFFTALGFAAFGIAVAATVSKIDQFSYVTTLVVTPLFLVAGTFFPINQLPEGFQAAAQLNPLHHLVVLVRHASFGFEATDPIRVAVLIAVGLALWRVAVRRMTARLID